MREILFRGKRIGNGEWVEGAFLNDRDGAFYICPAVSDISYRDGGNRRRIGCWYNVDPYTVGQYTGLKDKNGKRIFEGDIVKSIETKETGVVQFFPEHSAFMVWCKSSNEVGFLYECTSIAEVIGNIHDNPELLEEA